MVCPFELPPILSGFFTAALIRAKQVPIQLFQVEKGEDRWTMSTPGIKKTNKLEGIKKVADVKKK
jgi:hypothetical protein